MSPECASARHGRDPAVTHGRARHGRDPAVTHGQTWTRPGRYPWPAAAHSQPLPVATATSPDCAPGVVPQVVREAARVTGEMEAADQAMHARDSADRPVEVRICHVPCDMCM